MASKNNVAIGLVAVALLGAGAFFLRGKVGAGAAGEAGEEGSDSAGKGGKGRRGKGSSEAEGEGSGGEREGAMTGPRQKKAPEDIPVDSYEYKFRTAKAELEMAKADLENYQKSSRWPESARPSDEMAPGGGLLPHHVPATTLPMIRKHADGTVDEQGLSKSRVTLTQDRFQVIGDEAVNVLLQAADEKGKELPLRCAGAKAFAVSDKPLPPAEVTCVADKDGRVTSKFVPLMSPMRDFVGTIRLEYNLTVERPDGSSEGGTSEISIHYGGAEVARFNGTVRQAYENGSAVFYLGFDVLKAGFYRLNVRADNGQDDKVFAHMNVREQVDQPGPREMRVEVFGKLIKDSQAKMIRLRDMDGEYVPPAGEIIGIKGRDGVFFTAKAIDLAQVSGSDWQAPEKEERMTEYKQALGRAQENCDKNFNGCQR